MPRLLSTDLNSHIVHLERKKPRQMEDKKSTDLVEYTPEER